MRGEVRRRTSEERGVSTWCRLGPGGCRGKWGTGAVSVRKRRDVG
jgi:hypothetical protein